MRRLYGQWYSGKGVLETISRGPFVVLQPNFYTELAPGKGFER